MGPSFSREKLLSLATGLSSLPSNMPSSSYSGCCVAKHPHRPRDPGRLHWASPNLQQEKWAQTGPMSQTRRPLWSFATRGDPRGRPWGTGAGSKGRAAALWPPSHLSTTTRSALPSLAAASGAACAARSLFEGLGDSGEAPGHSDPSSPCCLSRPGSSCRTEWKVMSTFLRPESCYLPLAPPRDPDSSEALDLGPFCCPQETFSQSWGHCGCHNWEREVLWHLVGEGWGGC